MHVIVRAVRTAALAALCLSAAGLAGTPPLPGPPAPALARAAATTAATAAQQVLGLVNAERARAGCRPVRLDPRLTAAATRHSQDMAARDRVSHLSRDGSTFADRIRRAGHPAPRSENVAAGGTTAEATVRQWMDSPSHRANILDCTARDMGVGVGAARGSTYGTDWTQDFGGGER